MPNFMRLVLPAARYLPSYSAALAKGRSPDNLRPEVSREQLARIAQDPDRFLTDQVDREFKKLVHELQVHAVLARCTFFLLSGGLSQVVHPVHTLVDGLVRLTDSAVGRPVDPGRNVHSFCGSASLRGVGVWGPGVGGRGRPGAGAPAVAR